MRGGERERKRRVSIEALSRAREPCTRKQPTYLNQREGLMSGRLAAIEESRSGCASGRKRERERRYLSRGVYIYTIHARRQNYSVWASCRISLIPLHMR